MITASAPAKLILCGEHAVVYARPAIALPLSGVRAQVEITPRKAGGIVVQARDMHRRWRVSPFSSNPLSELILRVLTHFGEGDKNHLPNIRIVIRSTIPIASGMGSGAAVATALVRGLAAYFERELPTDEISALVYASEQRFHGTPSGIDNTVVAYEQPIWFQRAKDETNNIQMQPVTIAEPFTLLIGDTGVRSATRLPVGEVRRRWQEDTPRYEALFDTIEQIVGNVRKLLTQGDITGFGAQLNANHQLLQTIGVSSPELDRLVSVACDAGALGAKLSGAGWGGVMLALVTDESSRRIADALQGAGAQRVLETRIERSLTEDTI